MRFKFEWKHVLQMLLSSSLTLAEPQEAPRFASRFQSLLVGLEILCSVGGLARVSLLSTD